MEIRMLLNVVFRKAKRRTSSFSNSFSYVQPTTVKKVAAGFRRLVEFA